MKEKTQAHREPFHLSSVNTLTLIPTDPSFPAGRLRFPSVLPHTFTRPSRYFRNGPLTRATALVLQRNRHLRERFKQICATLPTSVCILFHNIGLNIVMKRLLVKQVFMHDMPAILKPNTLFPLPLQRKADWEKTSKMQPVSTPSF